MALKTVDVPKELEPTHAAVELTGSALREHGESVGTEGAIRDITERKRMEQRLVRQNGLLQAINQVFEKALACESEEAVAVVCLNVGEELTGSKFGFIGKLKEAGLFDTMAISNPGWDACKMPHSEAGKSIKGVPLRGIDRATMRDGKSRIVNDPASHADRVGVPEGHPPITCFLGVPLKQGDKTIGMIALANKEGGYDPADQEAVEALSVAFVEALERKRAEKSLRMSEQRYRQLLRAVTSYTYTVHLEDGVPVSTEHSSAAVVITDPQGRIEYVNPKFTTMTGYASQDVLGQTPRILNSGHHSAEFFKEMWDTILRGEEWHGELCNRRKDGHLQWENTSISPIRDDRGNITHFVAVKEDVTERKRTERALRLNESRLQALLQLNQMAEAPTPDITDFALEKAVELTESELGYLASMNEDETVLTVHSWSRAAMEQGAIVDKPLVYPVETTGLCGEAIRQRKPVITNDYAAPNPLKRGYPSGHVRISRHMDVPVFDGERIVAVAGVGNKDGEYDESDVRQLTLLMQGMWRLLQRKKSEEALRVSERKLRTMTAALGEGLIVQDDTGQLIFMNPEAERLLGWKESELLGKKVHTIIHANHGETGTPGEQDCMMQKAVRTGDAYRADTEVFAHRDGTKFPVSVVATPITEHDSIVGSITAFRDITQRKTTEETLRHKEEELRQSQKLETVGELAGGIAHEFNNLLQAIGGYTKYAMEGLPPGGQRYQDLQQVERAAGRAATLIRQLLGFGRRETLKPQDLCLNKVVTGVLKMLRPVIGEHIEVKTVFDNKVGTVHADPTLIEQVLMNLCINARDAMPSGGALTVETRDLVLSDAYCETHVDIKPGRHVQITVSDTGYGMAPEVVEHIFDPFYTTKEVGEGTGLGLAVVYGVVKQHGGGIHVYSEPGLGTNFKLFLPTVEKAVCSDNEEGPETVPGGTETILVAEDEPLVRDLAVRILTDAGYSVLPVSDGEEALRVFQTNANTVSLALLDLVMPKMTGRMVYQGIKMLKPEAKVLFCSGYDTDTNCGGFIANEGLQCVKKPFDSKELLRSVRETLDGEPTCQTLQTTS